jgi:16S rRNA (cytidine1402-2'-O)-methyltransferase
MTPGTLYVVATHIGNLADLTPRAAEILRAVPAVLCEERKEGRRLMIALGISDKELIEVNEHSEEEIVTEITELLRGGADLALISDCGTPLVADPGASLVSAAADWGIRIVPVPGPSSFMAALMISGFDANSFVFHGVLPVKKDERIRAIRGLARESRTQVVFDAPYRLERFIEDLAHGLGDTRQAVLAIDLTLPGETVIRGTPRELAASVKGKQWKREFVVVIAPDARRQDAGNRIRFRA